jgi:hypothetical protein
MNEVAAKSGSSYVMDVGISFIYMYYYERFIHFKFTYKRCFLDESTLCLSSDTQQSWQPQAGVQVGIYQSFRQPPVPSYSPVNQQH